MTGGHRRPRRALPRHQQAPGVVHVRLSGHAPDVDVLAQIIAASPAAEVITRSDRRDPDQRAYLTVRITAGP